eukprot:CAMPEP_0195286524 /NCGR_PEP_ID=MMETSP0707-20130614/3952_1 /TAXON_ID=33640 /ORGANISM="Asterionellopsis glacialis, Strain CCMP134" /LENGTH=683 /DNA_ID=CAMNT_0040346175 /DNA_START=124 /DNA_END=2175 /DNA_ORIENTATION=+
MEFIDYLQLPSTSAYMDAFQEAFHDGIQAYRSFSTLGKMTWKPVGLLLLLFAKGLWMILKFLGKHLFRGAFVSLQKGWSQLLFATNEFWKWQLSLSRSALIMEFSFIVMCMACYALRRYIQQQKYVERCRRWYTIRKRNAIQQYKKVVTRIARTSLFLAMLLPHVLFGGLVVTIKLVLPRFVTWVACETYGTSILSFWYPLIMTISILHPYRGRQQQLKENKKVVLATPAKSGTRTGMYPKTTPRTTTATTKSRRAASSPMVQRWIQAAMTPASMRRLRSRRRMGGDDHDDQAEELQEATFWLKYWIVYAVVLAICRIIYLTPVVGSVIGTQKAASILEELQFVFYIWLLALPMTTNDDRTHDFENRPLELLFGKLEKVIDTLYTKISTAIPDTFWQSYVVSNLKNILGLFVFGKFISETTKDKLIHYFEEGQSLVPPAITLFMPGFTQYGVMYVQTIVPAYKSCQPQTKITSSQTKINQTMKSLQYWVLQALWSSVLIWWSSLLWWIPFSSHFIFLSWCHLQIPRSTESWYKILEDELMAFGLLPRWSSAGDHQNFELDMENTTSLKVWRALVNRLPSAVEETTDKEEEQEEQQEDKDDSSTTAVVNNGDDDYDNPSKTIQKKKVQKKDDPMDIDINKENSNNGLSSEDDENYSSGGSSTSQNRRRNPVRRSTRRRRPLSSH